MPEAAVEGATGHVPPPLPPDDPEAWYAPDVRSQYEVHPNVVASLRSTDDGFAYDVREPLLGSRERATFDRVTDYFADAEPRKPLTREGTVERMTAGFEGKYRRAIDQLTDGLSAAARRRVEYHVLRDIQCLGTLTPLALDDRIEVADHDDGELLVHTDDFAPAETTVDAPLEDVERFASERIGTHTVRFHEFVVPVVLYRERLLGNDPFTTKYAVLEPDLLPGDEELIAECKERIWEANVGGVVEDRAAFVRDRAHRILERRLVARNTRAWLDATQYRLRSALATYDLVLPPIDRRFSDDRLQDLVYYVMRDYVGHGKLTIPVRDPFLEDVEANQVGERIKVVPRADLGHGERIPTNLAFESETEFVNVVTQLAASDGTELDASTPSAKVNVDPADTPDDVTIRCAVALPAISEGGPHISIRKQAPDTMTPIDLLDTGSISSELVALLWLCYEHHMVVLFSGPTGVGKTTLMNAHMPFIPYHQRPISIDEGSREVTLPHETGVSLTTRAHESEYKRVTMADLMTECNYLNPDVQVIAEINTPASFSTFAETLNTGHGVLGTTHAEDAETLVNRAVEQGLPAYLLAEIDLVVFPKRVEGQRYVGDVVELLSESEADAIEGATARIDKDGTTIRTNRVAWRDEEGAFELAYEHPDLGDDRRLVGCHILRRLADRTDRSLSEVEAEFHRKHRYVQYLDRAGIDEFEELYGFLADLYVDEAATVERERYGRET